MVTPSSRWGDPGEQSRRQCLLVHRLQALRQHSDCSARDQHVQMERDLPGRGEQRHGDHCCDFCPGRSMKWENTQKKMAADIEVRHLRTGLDLCTGQWLGVALAPFLDPSRDILARVDGLNVLAPGYGRCGDCRHSSRCKSPTLAAEVPIGTDIMFSAGSPAPSSCWAAGLSRNLGDMDRREKLASILPLPAGADTKPMRLSINAQGLLGEGHPSQTVTFPSTA